jgi:hypothetical protein
MEPARSIKVPAGHGEHVRAPVKLTIEPGAQRVQADAPATFENCIACKGEQQGLKAIR